MKNIIMVLIIISIAIIPQLLTGQTNKGRRPERPERTQEKLTAYQIKVVKAILSKYDKQALTSEDAIAIQDEIRKAGLELGPETDKVIDDGGFDAKKLRDLASPPKRAVKDEVNLQNTRLDNSRNNRNRAENIPITKISPTNLDVFRISSPAVDKNNLLASEFTRDGKGVSMPLEWENAPKDTKYFALNVWHQPNPSNESIVKSYWVLYDIPVGISSLPKNVQNIGLVGYNDKNSQDYDPMKSKGPGLKLYNITLYALSEKPVFTSDKVHRKELLEAIEDITIEECTLQYLYERKQNKAR